MALAAFVAGCGDNKADTRKQAGPPATLITVAKAEARTLEITEDSVGALENFIDPKVGAEVAGRVVSVQGFVGKKVKKGDPLAEIDASDLEIQSRADSAEMGRLEALVANQDRIIANQQKLVEKNFISQNALDESLAQGKALREQLAAARAARCEPQLAAQDQGAVADRWRGRGADRRTRRLCQGRRP